MSKDDLQNVPSPKASLFRAANAYRVTWSQRFTSPKCTDREGREDATQGRGKFKMSLEKRRLK